MPALPDDNFRCVIIYLFPSFIADNNMHRNLTFAVVIAVVNVIDPPEMLTASPPYRLTLVTALQRTQRFDFFPHRGQTFVRKHYHVLPPVVTAQFHQWAVRVEAIQQHHDRQAWKLFFQTFRQAFERLQFAVLLMVIWVTFGIA